MPFFVKRRAVRAMRWTGDLAAIRQWQEDTQGGLEVNEPDFEKLAEDRLQVQEAMPDHNDPGLFANPGDWVLRDPEDTVGRNAFIVLNDITFNRTYVEVAAPSIK